MQQQQQQQQQNNGASIEPCGSLYLIFFFTESAHSVMFTYCFLPFK